MNAPDLLRRSWALTTERKELQVFGTMSALFSILIGIPRLHYILRTDAIGWTRFYDILRDFLASPAQAGTTIVVLLAFLYVGAFLVHVLADGAIISSLFKSETSGQPVSGRVAFGLGLQSFLRLIEFKSVTALFSLSSVMMWVLIVDFYSARYLGGVSIVRRFLPLTVFLVAVLTFFSIAFTYAEYHFIAKRSTIAESLRRSMKLVAFYLSETMMLSVLLLLIFARTLVNILLVFLLPGVLFAVLTYFATQIAPAVALLLYIVVGAGTVWYAARISGTLMIFTHAVWTLTYLALQRRTDDVVVHAGPAPVEQAEEPEPPTPFGAGDIRVLPGRGPSTDSIFR